MFDLYFNLFFSGIIKLIGFAIFLHEKRVVQEIYGLLKKCSHLMINAQNERKLYLFGVISGSSILF